MTRKHTNSSEILIITLALILLETALIIDKPPNFGIDADEYFVMQHDGVEFIILYHL